VSFAHRAVVIVGFTTTLSITTKVVSPNPVFGKVYWIQHHVIQFVSDFRLVGGVNNELFQFSFDVLQCRIVAFSKNIKNPFASVLMAMFVL
jgi:hypothetical protein